MEEKTVQILKQRYLGILIEITDIPNLPMPLTKWTTEQLNHFDVLIEFAYKQYFHTISWNDPMKEAEGK